MISGYNPDWEPRRTVKRLWIILQTTSNKNDSIARSTPPTWLHFPFPFNPSRTRAGCVQNITSRWELNNNPVGRPLHWRKNIRSYISFVLKKFNFQLQLTFPSKKTDSTSVFCNVFLSERCGDISEWKRGNRRVEWSSSLYTCQLFLILRREIFNRRVPGFPKTTRTYPMFSHDFRRWPKTFRTILTFWRKWFNAPLLNLAL